MERKPVIKLDIDVTQAVAIRQVLYKEQEFYTYDPTCVPPRIVGIREVIVTLDKQIEDTLKVQEMIDAFDENEFE